MKKKLLYLTSIMLFSALSINAQTKIWDFGNDTANWPVVSNQTTSESVKDLLGLYASAGGSVANFGAITANVASGFSDGYTSVNRFQANGAGYSTGADAGVPTQRYIYFNVSGAGQVRVWFKGGNTSSTRSEIVSNGTTIIGQASSVNGVAVILTVALPSAGKYYIYGDAANNVYKIEVTGTTVNTPPLATDSFQLESNVAVYASEGKINVSNVTSATKVSVYSVLGSLVKSIETSEDASLSIGSGLYVVKAQSAEGTKTVKVLVK